jgi:hypothetical protein
MQFRSICHLSFLACVVVVIGRERGRYLRWPAQVTRQPSQVWRGVVVAADAWDRHRSLGSLPVGSQGSRVLSVFSYGLLRSPRRG